MGRSEISRDKFRVSRLEGALNCVSTAGDRERIKLSAWDHVITSLSLRVLTRPIQISNKSGVKPPHSRKVLS